MYVQCHRNSGLESIFFVFFVFLVCLLILSLFLPHTETNVRLCFILLLLKKAWSLCMQDLKQGALSCLRCMLAACQASHDGSTVRLTSLFDSQMMTRLR